MIRDYNIIYCTLLLAHQNSIQWNETLSVISGLYYAGEKSSHLASKMLLNMLTDGQGVQWCL